MTVFCCQSPNNRKYEKLINGEWILVDSPFNKDSLAPPVEFPNRKVGISFLNDSVFENKLGYFTDSYKYREFLLGTKTKYKIEDDNLKILNLENNSWSSLKICALNADTLILKNGDKLDKFVKLNYSISPEIIFDKIIVSSAGWGSNDISIDNQGNIFFSEPYRNTHNGLFTSKIPESEYLEFEMNFKKADIDSLKENYIASCNDCGTITVTFIKDNKIVKTIITDRLKKEGFPL